MRSRKTSSNDLSVYEEYMRNGIIKYGREGWTTWEIKRIKSKGVEMVICGKIKPSML